MTGEDRPQWANPLCWERRLEEDVQRQGRHAPGVRVKQSTTMTQSNRRTHRNHTKCSMSDKVDLVIGGDATAMLDAAMPVVMRKGKVFIGARSRRQHRFNYPKES